MTRFSDKTYTSLRVTEGYIPVIYSDSEGVPTVGLGCALVIYAPTASGNNEYKWKVRDNIDKILENIDGIEAIAEIKTKLQRAANIRNGIELGSNDFLPSSEFYDEKGKLKEDIITTKSFPVIRFFTMFITFLSLKRLEGVSENLTDTMNRSK